MKARIERQQTFGLVMSESPSVHILRSCPFCWKVRVLTDYLNLDVNEIQVNPMKQKKELKFAGDWGKVPVWTTGSGEVIVDSTPIMKYIDKEHFSGQLSSRGNQERNEEWLTWVDGNISKATVPILYGSIFSALKTTPRVAKMEKFSLISGLLYAWTGFPIMVLIAKIRIRKKFGKKKPKQIWHDLLDEFTSEFTGNSFFSGEEPGLVDFAAYGYMKSVSPYPQFELLKDHTAGMKWYNAMENASA